MNEFSKLSKIEYFKHLFGIVDKKYFLTYQESTDFPLSSNDIKNSCDSLAIEYYCIFIYPFIQNQEKTRKMQAIFKRSFIASIISFFLFIVSVYSTHFFQISNSINLVFLISALTFLIIMITSHLRAHYIFEQNKLNIVKKRLETFGITTENKDIQNISNLEDLWVSIRLKGMSKKELIENLELLKIKKKQYEKDIIQFISNLFTNSNFIKLAFIIIAVLIKLSFVPITNIIEQNIETSSFGDVYKFIASIGVLALYFFLAFIEIMVIVWGIRKVLTLIVIQIEKPCTYSSLKVDMLIKLLTNYIEAPKQDKNVK